MRKIKRIYVHHSISNWGDGKAIRKWHKEKGYSHIGYQCVILNGYRTYNSDYKEGEDGTIERTLPEGTLPISVKWGNSYSLAVCLIGNFDKYVPSQKQWDSLCRLLKFWLKKYGLCVSAIEGHREAMVRIGREKYVKSCPGKKFLMGKLRKELVKEWEVR